MPSLITDYHKPLETDPHIYATPILQQGIVVGTGIDTLEDPLFIKLTLLELTLGCGYVVFEELIPANIDTAEALCIEAHDNGLDAFEVYNYIKHKLLLRSGKRFGQIFFGINPPLEGPQISGAYVEEEYRQYGISTLAYSLLAKHYGVVYSDRHQTIYGAKLWYAGLPKFGVVRAIDTHAGNKIIETFVMDSSPKHEHWDNLKLKNEPLLLGKVRVPTSDTESKDHIVLEFQLKD
ncbi:hypothetical protein [Shewanella sp.]|uniref:hypothetical protein n=1 Tax=Shewanella sp. TaxID=50422 RepID=UPI001EB6CF4D|nr:hypothetical protein [Shewanella sp.]NRB23138.1 hypothetical protein [Shewanella sp.]